MRMHIAIGTASLLVLCYLGSAQQKTIKHVPMKATSPASGREMFNNYCASCHGEDAKGDGPAASALKVAPPDLTTLAKRKGGKFPSAYVASILEFGTSVPAHGSPEMPIWGPLFRSLNRGNTLQVKQRVTNLTDYLKSLQSQ